MKKQLRSIAVIVVTLALLYFVVRRVGVGELLATLQQADLRYALLSFLISVLLMGVSVAKWQILLEAQGHEASFWYLYKLYLVGYFFNHFLPSNVGGDFVRMYELGSHIDDPARGAASVFMERLTGLLVLALLAAFSFLTHLTLFNDTALTLAMGVVIVAMFGVVWLVVDPRLLNLIERVVRFEFAQKLIAKYRKFYTALQAYKDNRRALVLAFMLSLAFYVLAVLNVYFSSLTFHQPVSLLDITVIVPIILIVAMMPFTFNGYGIQEWAYVLLYPRIGLAASVGLSAIVLIRAKNLILALIGGLLYPGIRLRNQEEAPPTPSVQQPEGVGVADKR